MATITTPPQPTDTTHLDLKISASCSPSLVQPRARLMRLRWMDTVETPEYQIEYHQVLQDRLPKVSKA